MKSAISEKCFKIWMVIAILLLIPCFQASSGAGNIHTKENFAWSENTGWINMSPTNTGAYTPVTVYDSYISGYAWGENIGWIKMSSSGSGQFPNETNSDWGVNVGPRGSLAGYAWSVNAGWINFNWAFLDRDTGVFSGYAYGDQIGYIKLHGLAESGVSYTLTTPRLTIDNTEVEEDSLSVVFTVTLSTIATEDVTFSYKVIEGCDNTDPACENTSNAANSSEDYHYVKGTERIQKDTTSQTIPIQLKQDDIQESAEFFTLYIYDVKNASIEDSKGIAKILDDDGHTITFKVGEYGAITTRSGTSVTGYTTAHIIGGANTEQKLSVEHEDDLYVYLMPDPGKIVSSILLNGKEIDFSNDSFKIEKIREDYEYVINFIDTTFNITLDQNIEHGGCILSGTYSNIEYNESRTVICTGDTNYQLIDLSVCGNTVTEALKQQSYTHTFNVTKNCYIDATFAIDSYLIMATVASGEGAITALENVSQALTDTQNRLNMIVEHNKQPKIRIAPDGFHHIKDIRLYGDSVSKSIYNQCTFDGTACELLLEPVTQDYTLTATFDGNAYTLGMIAEDGGYISYTDSSGEHKVYTRAFIPVAYNSSRTIKIGSDDTNLLIADINKDGTSLTRLSTKPYTLELPQISAHHVIHARFAHILVTKSDQTGGFDISASPVATAYRSIQDALEAADNYKDIKAVDPIIAVDPGTYSPVTFVKQSLTLYAIQGPETTIIDANKDASCFKFEEISNSVKVSGFTLQNGLAENGGGIYIDNSSPEISNCRIIDNEANTSGGGIYVSIVSTETSNPIEPRFSKLYIRGNIAGEYGGGVYCGGKQGKSILSMSQSIIRKNTSDHYGGGVFVDGINASSKLGEIRLASSWVVENQSFSDGAGIYIDDNAIADIFTTTISKNTFKDGYGGGIFAKTSGGYSSTVNVTVKKSILWNNNREIDGNLEQVDIDFCTIEGGIDVNNNNYNINPSFVDDTIGDYHLSDTSSLIDKGGISINKSDPMYFVDIDGYTRKINAGIDIGADEWNNMVPNVNFLASNTKGYSPFSVTFTNKTSGQTTLHIWEFGDGEVSNELNPTHIYKQPGIYTVQLTVYDNYGYAATRSRYDYIVVEDNAQEVIPDFIAAPSDSVLNNSTDVLGITGYMPLTVKFHNLTTPDNITPPPGYPTPWRWDFGDGLPVNTEESPMNTFSNPGTYSVKLTVIEQGENGEPLRKTKTRYGYITVLDPEPEIDFKIVPQACICTSNPCDCTVTVYDCSKFQNEISQWQWFFDDGNTPTTIESSSPMVTHSFTEINASSLKIGLTVGSDTKQLNIDVKNIGYSPVNQEDNIQDIITSIDDDNASKTIILISAGTYNGNIDLKGKDLTIKAKPGDEHQVFIKPTDLSKSTIQIMNGETVTLDGLVIQENLGTVKFGGGILVDAASSLILRNCIVKKNRAQVAGGGIAFLNNAQGIIENSVIGGTASSDNNTAPYGGGIACLYASSPLIVGNTCIQQNISTKNGGGIYAYASSNPVIMNTTILSNVAEFGMGGGIYASQSEPYIVSSTIIQGNRANYGGGIYWKNANFPVIRHSQVLGNRSKLGGGIYAEETIAPQIINVLIAGNNADIHGSGSYLNAVSSANYLFSTIANNTATQGTGFGIYGANLAPGLIVKNSILKNNGNVGGDEIFLYESEPAQVSHSAINQAEYAGSPNISEDPNFITYGTASPNYRLNSGSPCQDAADVAHLVSTDLSGNDRTIGNAPDLGVYESNMWPIKIIHNGFGKVMDASHNMIQSGDYAAIAHKESGSFTIEPSVGYTITDILVNDVSEFSMMTFNGNQMVYTFTDVQKMHQLKVVFERYYIPVTLIYQGETNNSTTNEIATSFTMTAETETGIYEWLLPGKMPSFDEAVYHGSALTLTALPGVETQRPEFSGGIPVEGHSNSQLFSTISEPMIITVTAKLKLFDVTIQNDTNGTGQGTYTPTSAQVKYGDSITLKASPDKKSSKFSGWTGDYYSNNTTITIANVQQRYDLVGRFDYKDISVIVRKVGIDGKLTGLLNSNEITNLDTFVAEQSEGYQIPNVIFNNTLELYPQKRNSWEFHKWEWTESNESEGYTSYSSVISEFEKDMQADSYSITCYYKLDERVLTIKQQENTDGSGMIIVDNTARSLPITLTYPYGTSIELEAVADTYSSTFLGWSGRKNSSNKLINVTFDEYDMKLFVNFSLKEYAITARASGFGEISPTGTQYVKFGADIPFELERSGDYAYLSDIIIDRQSKIDALKPITTYPYTYSFTNVTQAHTIDAIFSQFIQVEQGESIQGAINSSKDGDTIRVEPGIYRENINFNGKAITVESETPFAAVIDGQYLMSTVRFVSDESSRAILSGFIIRHGEARTGGGIYIDKSSPTIQNCRIEYNTGELFGGGIYISGDSSPLVINTTVQHNESNGSGAGIYCYQSTPTFAQSVITQNESQLNGGALYIAGNAKPSLDNMLIYDNFARYNGGGIAVNSSSVHVKHCTVSDNHAGEGVALYAENVQAPNQVVVQNSIFWQTDELVYHVIASDNISNIQVTGSNIFQKLGVYPGTGNISDNPYFVDPETDNYQITINSSGRDKGLDLGTEALSIDHEGFPRLYGQEVDMGAFEFNNHKDITHIDFHASTLTGYSGTTIQFTGYAFSGLRTYTANEYEWDFGQAATPQILKGKQQSVTFNQPGQFVIRLTVDTVFKEKVVVIKETPSADFIASTTGGYAPLQVHFTNTTQSTHDIQISQWSFGDGFQINEQNPSHVFERAGKYTVKLTVTDKYSSRDICTKYDYITVIDNIPDVDFIARPMTGQDSLTVQFFDTTNSYQALKSWSWNFGHDGESSTNQNPVHTYNTPGVYSVSLIVKDSSGNYRKTREILVVDSNIEPIKVCKTCRKRSSAEFPTIQGAINAANDGDVIEVYDGSYSENISFNGKNVKVISKNGPTATTIISANDNSVVIFNQNENSGALLEGFTIINGRAAYGAGILIADGASPSIMNCTIKTCTADISGGGIAVIGKNTRPNISDVTIYSNYAPRGAGIACLNEANMFLNQVSISQNIANDSGGGIYIYGDATISANSVALKDNQAANYGGGIFLNQTRIILRDMIIQNNDASYGSGIAMRANNFSLIDRCRITNQKKAIQGGGIYAWSCESPEIRNTFLTQNHADDGGGIYFKNVTTPLVHFSTLAENYADSGEGKAIYVFSDQSDISPLVNVRNSILWNGGQEIKTSAENMAMVTWSNIATLASQTNWLEYTGNINENPMFTKDFNYYLDLGSPCKNSAHSELAPNADYQGDFRPLGSGYDMGADEATNVSPVAKEETIIVLEDMPTEITLPAYDEDGDNLTYEIIDAPSPDPETGRSHTLDGTGKNRTYKPAPNFNGTVVYTFKVKDEHGNDSNEGKLTIIVDPVNDPPEFTIMPTIEVYEKSSINSASLVTTFNCGAGGHSNESSQSLTFHIKSVTNEAYFLEQPQIDSAGKISFTVNGQTGTSDVIVELQDDGDTSNNGQNISSEKLFRIEIKEVNDRPEFELSSDSVSGCEDASRVTIKGFAENINKGDEDEYDQRVWFVVAVDDPELFQEQPTIAISDSGDVTTNGDLTFVPAPNKNGTATMTIYLKDDGCPDTGCAEGHYDTSFPKYAKIHITSVNDRPHFTSGGDVTVDEDSGSIIKTAWIQSTDKGAPDEETQVLEYLLETDYPQLFKTGPSISPTGDLYFTPADDMHGIATVSVKARDDGGTDQCNENCIGIDTSYAKSFLIIVKQVNDPPTFAFNDHYKDENLNRYIITVDEDQELGSQIVISNPSLITNVSPGNEHENDQQVQFHTATEQRKLFHYEPHISSDGHLTFALNPNVFGEANVSVYLKDSQGATSQEEMFTIRITEVNDPPTFNMSRSFEVFEDSGEIHKTNWASNINQGPDSIIYDPPYDESDQTINFILSTDNSDLFYSGPTIDSEGTLRFKTNSNMNGSATITVELDDNCDYNHLSGQKEFILTVIEVNDPPAFNIDPKYEITEGTYEIEIDETTNPVIQSYTPFAIDIRYGDEDGNEDIQFVDFSLTSNNPELFTEQPAIDKNGKLTFKPKPNAAGLAVVYVTLEDTGGTANNGKNTYTKPFNIRIKAINDKPVFTLGTDPIVVSEDCGLHEEIDWITGISPGGGADEANQSLTFDISVVDGNNDQFFTQPPRIVFNNSVGSLLFEPGPDKFGTRQISVFLKDSLGEVSLTKIFTIQVDPINDTPTFELNYEKLTIREGQVLQPVHMASNIGSGAANEDEDQKKDLSFVLTVNDPDLFSEGPTMDAEGMLTFQTADDQSGDCTIEVQLNDNQPKNNLSPKQTFILSIEDVNDPPTFTKGPDLIIKEDSRVQYELNWATNIDAGAPNESFQQLSFDVQVSKPTLFLVQPQVRNDGMLSYTPAPDAFGSTQVSVTLRDNGGTDFGGVNTSVAQPFTITILPVNDRPSFDLSQETVRGAEDSGQQSIALAYNINAGPKNEYTQEVDFIIETNNEDLFELGPTINYSGRLSFTPKPDAFGSATVSVYLLDNGGIENNGINTSTLKYFTIVVDPENDKPSFVIENKDIKANEDASNQKISNWATEISAGNNEDQVLTFQYDIDNSHLFKTLPVISNDGTLTFTPEDDETGYAELIVWLEDDTKYGPKEQSIKQTFRITIIGVNDKPVFRVGPELTVYEDSGSHIKPEWAYDISAGAPNESGQTLTFHASTDNTTLFQTQPKLTPDGDLSFHLAPNQWGTSTVTLTLQDTGGIENGGQDISNIERITIKVLSVNDAPFFTKGPDQIVSEGANLQEKLNWATNINPGPPDESDQTILFSIVVDKPQLFEIQPSITPDGKLTYKPDSDASGIATVNVTAMDNGGTDNGGVNTSDVQTFTITIEGSNDPPSFVKGHDPTALEDSGEQVFQYWATHISAGGPGEEDQELEFIVTVSNPELFDVLPAINKEGTLTFTPKADEFGETEVEVILKDDGNGTNMSNEETFKITITPVNDPPSFTRGANLIIFEDRGEQVIPNWVTNINLGPWNEWSPWNKEGSQKGEFQVIPQDPRFFASGPTISENGELRYTPALNKNGDVSIRIYLKDDGGRLNGGEDTSAPQDFNITILGINDAPSFNLHSSTYSINEDSGRQVVSNWASYINTGAVDEAGQNVVFRLTHEFEDMFSEQPAISKNGVLTFTPKADASGEAKILIFLEDDGGTANGGINVSQTKEFIIDIKDVNDPPSFNKGSNVSVYEDSSAKVVKNWASNISPGAPSESGQSLTFKLVVSRPELFAYGPEISSEQSSMGTLTFTPAPNASGIASIDVTLKDSGGVIYSGDDDTSDVQTFTIEIIPTNDKPTFTVGPNQDVLEGAGNQIIAQWATQISAGSEDEKDQDIEFKLETNKPELFIREPAVYDDGTLHYELKDNVSGVASVTIYLEDNGPSIPPHQNISDEKSFKITVLPVNDPPVFTKGPNKFIAEDATEQRFENWATNITPGPADESTQILTFNITTDNDDLFAIYPTVSSTGTLIFKTKPDLNGVANINIQLHDDGGNDNGGISSSAIQVFMITVYEVNDQPTFLKGSDQIILEDAGEQNVIGWAKDIRPGPVNESNQMLTFHVTPDNSSLFAVPPEIDITGKLTYTPKNETFGSTLVSVFLRDNGGVQNGGNNTSAMYQFTIRIESVNDAPSFTPGPDKTVIKSSGLNSYSNWATNIIPGPPNESSQALNFVSATSGDSIFTQNPSVSPSGTLSFIVASGKFGSATVSLYLKDDGSTLNGGKDRSETITFNISVIDANAPPFFTKGLDQSVPEDCGEIRIANWATGIDPGAPDEIAQTVEFKVSTDNDSLFSSKPEITPLGELYFMPSPNLYGVANVTIHLKDDGGTTNGGDDTSDPQEFKITVLSVNDQPEFRMENEFICREDDPEQYQVNWAYNINAGPDNEDGQALTFHVTTQQPELFSQIPTINPLGTLSFKSAPNQNGQANVTVQLQDDGGTQDGGNDTSNDYHFTITITPVNDPPVNTTIPWITGTPQIGETLTGHDGIWHDNIDIDPGILTYLFQWQGAYNASETNPTDIPGERQRTFLINNSTPPYIRLEITAWDDGEGTPGSLSTVAYSRYIGIGKDLADIDGNGKVDLGDVLITIQSLSGVVPQKPLIGGDMNGDGQIGLADIIHILVQLSE